MYKVYCGDKLLMATKLEEYKLINPKVTTELNKTGSFTFTIYPNHPNYDVIERLSSIITVYQGEYLLFRGRVIEDTLGFHNEKQVTCEGELAFLVDSIQRPYDFQSDSSHTSVNEFFNFLINNHNAQVEESHQFKVGQITVIDDYIVRADSSYANTWDSIKTKLIDILGGYVFIRHEEDGNYIDYLSDFNRLSSQTIEFGENLLDIKRVCKGTDTASCVIPIGATLENGEVVTIKSVNDNKDYIYDPAAVNAYGWISKVIHYDDVTDPYNLLQKARAELGSSINLSNSIELSAVDLSAIKKDINAFHLGTYVKVISNPHNVNANFLVSKIVISLLNPKQNKLTLGKTFTSFTEKTQAMSKGEKGDPGPAGPRGKDAATKSAIEPEDKTVMWLDISVDPPILKSYNDTTNEWEVVSDMISIGEAIRASELRTSAQITETSDSIITVLNENYYLKEDTDKLVSNMQTEWEQTAQGFEMRFGQFSQDLNDLLTGTDAQFQEISKYIRFENGNIILGEADNPLILKIQNNRISFIHDNNEVAYFDDQKLYVTDGEYTNSLQLGKFAFLPRTTGNLSFKKVIE